MIVFETKAHLVQHVEQSIANHKTIGFVPTMGALHAGHLSLLTKSLLENHITVISIFVNPTQFNNPDDLQKYPRTLAADIQKIESVSSTIIVFAPSVNEIYEGHTQAVSFDFDGLEKVMEGAFRPGHFDGVGTIVKKLFEIVKPTNAYFGEKDFQQLQIIKKMVQKNHLPVNIVQCPIFREQNGLAMSSRNERLTTTEREQASVIYQTLLNAKKQFQTKTPQEVLQMVEKSFEQTPLFKLEYFQIADENTLLPCISKQELHKYRAFIAVFVNNIRLIDTILLN
ncbi:pantoate--beta-alanine ligase [Flavobacterium branchiophilum NBRC 15030 = ATCC 35035]|uniref:Pantothenate synthetase n=1 Tax=Flavobacterium branchiophilum TaxID=55197 RepID=A0A543G3X4_9FLAO|nr:pantoate--beta-alanine ligase [Flavobacterium branchiophilum]OXA82224.1 pantoate--beta-alanine ligase [Flavobacterium branchiophilum NBRC 15030 = ATCC 35035]TQM40783.1 pantothenate synthetase [Flavobacterium branchiophilum]GEM55855.1 pantothenate synthetase [Flavobacterium branchiophilum NBRC 15030 = ATCC 35035]